MNGAKSNYYAAAETARVASAKANASKSSTDRKTAADAHTKAAGIIRAQSGLVGRTNASRVGNMHDNAARNLSISGMHGIS